jgi:peptidoglycan hydrolase-like protein with peptidoglycan-binding domain
MRGSTAILVTTAAMLAALMPAVSAGAAPAEVVPAEVVPAEVVPAEVVPAQAAQTSAGVDAARAAAAERSPLARLDRAARFAREPVRITDRDRSPRRIEHVTELQYRLRWVGAYNGRIDGYFGDRVRRAVRKYQERVGLRPSGVVGEKTWAKLIPQTVKGRGLIPRECKKNRGWHLCYDRYRHAVTLWKHGTLRNSWLVRGGDRGYETRTGSYTVFRRAKDHVSGIYGTPMPYSQFFSGGQAFHGSAFMMDPWEGHSAGCVNMYIEDARQLWSMTSQKKLRVHIRGQWDRTVGPGVGTRQLDIFG